MGDRIGVLVVHGMGSHQPGYSEPLIQEVGHRLGERAGLLVWEEMVWASALRPREERLWTDLQGARSPDGTSIPLAWLPARQFVLHFFGTAAAYHHDAGIGAREAIHDLLSNHLTHLGQRLDDAAAPIVVLAHSLGGHIVSDYVWDRQHPSGAGTDGRRAVPTLTAIITFGCTIPLFGLAFDVPIPVNLPGPEVTGATREAARWLNFLDRDDVVAWPLKPLYAQHLDQLTPAQQETVSRIEDHEIDVGGPITRWNPASHDGYWADDDFVRPVAAYLDTLLRAWHESTGRPG